MPTALRPSQIQKVPTGKILPVLLASIITETTVGNTITETAVLTRSIPGGVLGINDTLLVRLQGSFLYNSTGTITWRFKYGATTIATISALQPLASASTFGYEVRAWLKNAGVTNSQKGVLIAEMNILADDAANGTAAIDSTVAQNLVVTAQWSTANASQTLTQFLASITYLPAI